MYVVAAPPECVVDVAYTIHGQFTDCSTFRLGTVSPALVIMLHGFGCYVMLMLS